MPRAKSLASRKHREVKKATRGFRHSRRKRVKAGKEALLHAGQYAFSGRKLRKRDLRKLWIIRLNAAAREQNLTYSQLMAKLKDKKVDLNRKVLSEICVNDPQTFEKIISEVK